MTGMANMRGAWVMVACIIFTTAIHCLAGRAIDDSSLIPISGELVWLDPANGRGKSLFRMEGESLGKPVVVEKTVYVASSHALHALDAATGQVKWQFTADSSIFTVAATPRQIFVAAAGMVVALEPTAGKQLWKCDSDLAMGEAVLVDGLVIFNSIDGPTAIDQQTGKLRWQLPIQWEYFVFSPMSDHRLCVWKPDEIFVVDTERGKTLWQSSADQGNSAPGALPTPAVAVDNLICQLRGTPKDANDWSLQGRDGGSGRSLWRTPLGQREAVGARTTIAGKSAYCVLGDQLTSVDVAEGKLKWQATIKPMEAGGAGLLCGQGLVYLPQLGGEVTALDESTGKAKWIAGAPQASPRGQIRVGGMCVTEAGVYVTRNDQVRQ